MAKYTLYVCASNSSLQFHIKKRDYLNHIQKTKAYLIV